MADSAATRLRKAAFALFEERGYDGTSVDEIARRAGVSRATFFRTFRSKEDVIFPDHALVLERIRARLEASDRSSAALAVAEAARLVLRSFLDEGDLARSRYRLTRSVPTLRDRELASMQQYQHAFREFIRTWIADEPAAELRAELMAVSVVTAHNVVLRRWLRGVSTDPEPEFDEAMSEVAALFSPRQRQPEPGTSVAVFRSDLSLEDLLPALRQVIGDSP